MNRQMSICFPAYKNLHRYSRQELTRDQFFGNKRCQREWQILAGKYIDISRPCWGDCNAPSKQ